MLSSSLVDRVVCYCSDMRGVFGHDSARFAPILLNISSERVAGSRGSARVGANDVQQQYRNLDLWQYSGGREPDSQARLGLLTEQTNMIPRPFPRGWVLLRDDGVKQLDAMRVESVVRGYAANAAEILPLQRPARTLLPPLLFCMACELLHVRLLAPEVMIV